MTAYDLDTACKWFTMFRSYSPDKALFDKNMDDGGHRAGAVKPRVVVIPLDARGGRAGRHAADCVKPLTPQ